MGYMSTQYMLTKHPGLDISLKAPEFHQVSELEQFFHKSMNESFSYFPREALEYYSLQWTPTQLTKRLENQSGLILCAWQNTQIVGLIAGSPIEGGVGTIIWLMVDPKYQNNKIGSQLLTKTKEYYKNVGAHKIKLTVHDEKAIKFYLREGFYQEALHKHHWWKMDFCSMCVYLD